MNEIKYRQYVKRGFFSVGFPTIICNSRVSQLKSTFTDKS